MASWTCEKVSINVLSNIFLHFYNKKLKIPEIFPDVISSTAKNAMNTIFHFKIAMQGKKTVAFTELTN